MQSPIKGTRELNQWLFEVWSASAMPQHVTDKALKAIDEWPKRLWCCLSTKGRYF